jgi:hypothetical protein
MHAQAESAGMGAGMLSVASRKCERAKRSSFIQSVSMCDYYINKSVLAHNLYDLNFLSSLIHWHITGELFALLLAWLYKTIFTFVRCHQSQQNKKGVDTLCMPFPAGPKFSSPTWEKWKELTMRLIKLDCLFLSKRPVMVSFLCDLSFPTILISYKTFYCYFIYN